MDETDVPTQRAQARQDARFPQADVDQGRTGSDPVAPGEQDGGDQDGQIQGHDLHQRAADVEIVTEIVALKKFYKAEDFPRFKAQENNLKRIYKELATPDAVLDAPIKQEETP